MRQIGNYSVFLKIADYSSHSKSEDRSLWGRRDTDHEYSELETMLQDLSAKGANNICKLEYMKQSIPSEANMYELMEFIIDYYDDNFNMSSDKSDTDIIVRMFLHEGSKTSNGDASGSEIRIFCKNIIAEINKNSALIGKNFTQKLENIAYDKRLCYTNTLLLTLAHEFFHVVHFRHIAAVRDRSSDSMELFIMYEAMADHFAYSCLKYYLREKSEEAFRQLQWNHTVDVIKQARHFGIGRKSLTGAAYSREEIDEDHTRYQEMDEAYKSATEYGVTDADYAGGYILYYMSSKSGKQAKEYEIYDRIYQQVLNGDGKAGLYELIELKREWEEEIHR